jgi:DNA-binding Lrp family transcriptional regulator
MFDKDDMRILSEMNRNSRQSFRKIAKKLNLATTTVINKHERMRKNGVIRGSTLVVDYEKAGYTLTALIELTVSKGKLVEVEEKIAKKSNVYGVYDITGAMDVMLLAKFRNREELNDFVKSVLAMDYVERTNTHFVLNIVKEDSRTLL